MGADALTVLREITVMAEELKVVLRKPAPLKVGVNPPSDLAIVAMPPAADVVER